MCTYLIAGDVEERKKKRKEEKRDLKDGWVWHWTLVQIRRY